MLILVHNGTITTDGLNSQPYQCIGRALIVTIEGTGEIYTQHPAAAFSESKISHKNPFYISCQNPQSRDVATPSHTIMEQEHFFKASMLTAECVRRKTI